MKRFILTLVAVAILSSQGAVVAPPIKRTFYLDLTVAGHHFVRRPIALTETGTGVWTGGTILLNNVPLDMATDTGCDQTVIWAQVECRNPDERTVGSLDPERLLTMGRDTMITVKKSSPKKETTNSFLETSWLDPEDSLWTE